jgi:CBS-domain-containing membrane protein
MTDNSTLFERFPKLRMKKNVAVTLSVILGMSIILFVTMLLFNVTDYGTTIASFGATIFMVLSQSKVSRKKIFGAYIVAALAGYMFSRFSEVTQLNAALAAIASIVLMTMFEFQHAPAIGIALSMVLNKFSFWIDVLVILCIFMILGMTITLKLFLQSPEKMIKFIELEEEKIKWNFRPRENPDYLDLKAKND